MASRQINWRGSRAGLGKVAERASGARRKLARPAGREGRKGKKEEKEKERGKGKEEKKEEKRKKGRKTSHPRIAHGQRYPMPCLE